MRSPSFAAVVLVLAGCGARTSLTVADAAARRDAVPDAALPDAPPDVPTACRWVAGAALALTTPDRDRAPLAVRVLNDRVWVGYQSSNPDPPGNQGWFVRVTDALGAPLAPAREVLSSPGEFRSYGPMSLWTQGDTGEHAAQAWDAGNGCRIVRLSGAATPLGAPVRAGDRDCASVVATGGGWTYLTRDDGGSAPFVRLHVVDGAGRETDARRLPPADHRVTAATRLVYADGSFLYVWVASPAGAPTLFARRHDAHGRPLGPAHEHTGGRDVAAPRVVPLRDGVLLGWWRTEGDGRALVSLTRASLDGAARGAAATLPTPGDRARDWALAVAQDVPAVLWSARNGGDAGALRFVALDPATLAARDDVEVPAARFPHNVSLRATSRGFVGVFGAIRPAGLTQVWTVALRCAPAP